MSGQPGSNGGRLTPRRWASDHRGGADRCRRLQQDFVVELRGLALIDVDADGKTHVDGELAEELFGHS